jgi:predicted RNA-binding protein with RPS1 domain
MRRVGDLQPYVGRELEAKIIELDTNRINVVLSRRAYLEQTQSEVRTEFLNKLAKGQVRKGVVSSIVNFGAFVDLGGVDGLVHVSELSWKHVDHPGEVVTVGQEVDVEVLDVDLERERVSLSLKSTQEDPWKEFERKYKAGEIIEGQVTKLVPFGAFVRVAQGIEGLVHISELSHEHVESPEAVLSVGDEVRVKVIDVDVSRRRVSLSMRQVSGGGAPPREPEIKAEPAAEEEVEAEMVPATIAVPQAILDAVAEAEAHTPVPSQEAAMAPPEPVEPTTQIAPEPEETPESTDVTEAPTDEVPIEAAPAEVETEVETEAEPEAAAEPEAPQAEAEEDAEGGSDEVSLEAILEDLKRREGRND